MNNPVNNPRIRNIVIWVLIAALVLGVFITFRPNSQPTTDLKFSQLVQDIKDGQPQIVSIDVYQNEVRATYPGNEIRVTRKDPTSSLAEQLVAFGVTEEELSRVTINNNAPADIGPIIQLIGTFLPLLLIGGFIYLMLRQAQGSNNQAMSFGKSRARMFNSDQPTVTFEDVAGADEAKEELREVVEFLKEPEKFIQLGARIPKGVLMFGAPGTGKTLLAKSVAGEAGVPFFSISGSEFVEMFVGVGASRVRDLFEQAKRHSPCIIFVDEIDAVGRQRGAGLGGSHDEREQTLNQILVEMDGFDTDTNIIVMAATNRPDILDPALMRPGRFDRRVIMDRPDMRGREAILKVHSRGKPMSSDVDLRTLARNTAGFVGADLENLVNEAAILAARKNKKTITMRELEESVYKVMMGPERKSRVVGEDQKKLVAYHEAGHAVVAHLLHHTEQVSKITIIPRGFSGGMTVLNAPEDDTMIETRARIKDMIVMSLGGRAAEEIVFGEITTGAGGGNGSDLSNVTKYARAMVQRYGMSDRLGPMMFGQKEEMVFLGREIGEQRDYSEAVAQVIDEEVRKIVDESYDRARQILSENRDKLDTIAARLLEVETVDYEEFLALMGESQKRKRLEVKPSANKTPTQVPDKGTQQGSQPTGNVGGALPNPA